jgi:hypothetical protein
METRLWDAAQERNAKATAEPSVNQLLGTEMPVLSKLGNRLRGASGTKSGLPTKSSPSVSLDGLLVAPSRRFQARLAADRPWVPLAISLPRV